MLITTRCGCRWNVQDGMASQPNRSPRIKSCFLGAAIVWVSLAVGCESQSPPVSVEHEEVTVARETIPEPFRIQLTGTQHRWRAEYPVMGCAAELLSAERDLHVPVDTIVVLILKSTDYIYTLAIPEFGLKEIAVPELEFRMEFRPTKVGSYSLIGEELCGTPGLDDPVRLIVEPRAEFQAWLRRKSASF